MKHTFLAFLVIMLASVLALGCGGSGSGVSDPGGGGGGGTPSVFAGTYSGTWENIIRINGHGDMTMVVGTYGSWTATGHDNASGADFTASGAITNAGALTGTLKMMGKDFAIAGTASLGGSPLALSGSIVGTAPSGSRQELTFVLRKK